MAPLEITDLQTHFFARGRVLKTVDGISLSIEAGAVLAVVGESGCGKSVTAASILGLVPNPPGRIVGGGGGPSGSKARSSSACSRAIYGRCAATGSA